MKNTIKNMDIIARIMDLAKLHLNSNNEIKMRSSAELCYKDACDIFKDYWSASGYKEIPVYGVSKAMKSLAYSVGHWHKDYEIANRICAELMYEVI